MESDILFVQPSFMRGLSRIADMWGLIDQYNYCESERDADKLALASDASAVSKDFWRSFETTLLEAITENPELARELEKFAKEKLVQHKSVETVG